MIRPFIQTLFAVCVICAIAAILATLVVGIIAIEPNTTDKTVIITEKYPPETRDNLPRVLDDNGDLYYVDSTHMWSQLKVNETNYEMPKT